MFDWLNQSSYRLLSLIQVSEQESQGYHCISFIGNCEYSSPFWARKKLFCIWKLYWRVISVSLIHSILGLNFSYLLHMVLSTSFWCIYGTPWSSISLLSRSSALYLMFAHLFYYKPHHADTYLWSDFAFLCHALSRKWNKTNQALSILFSLESIAFMLNRCWMIACDIIETLFLLMVR